MTKKQSNLAVSVPTKEDTLEQRIMNSNLSDNDKIELIKKIGQVVYYYPYRAPLGNWEYIYCSGDNTVATTVSSGNRACR